MAALSGLRTAGDSSVVAQAQPRYTKLADEFDDILFPADLSDRIRLRYTRSWPPHFASKSETSAGALILAS